MKNINRYKANVDNIPIMIKPILGALEGAGVEHKVCYKINLALEELLANVCLYAYYPEQGDVEICFDLNEEPKYIEISIIDEGKAFNPLEKEDPDTNLSVENRPIGGLGILLVKKNMDNIEYKYEDNKNILILSKNVK